MDIHDKVATENKQSVKSRKKIDFTRFTNLLYEASSSLVPGTGELYNTKYADGEEDKGIK
jgi:hypothetical protein